MLSNVALEQVHLHDLRFLHIDSTFDAEQQQLDVLPKYINVTPSGFDRGCEVQGEQKGDSQDISSDDTIGAVVVPGSSSRFV